MYYNVTKRFLNIVKVWFAWFYHYYGFLKSLQVFVGSAYLSLTKKTFFKNEVVFLCEIARNRYGIWVLVWNLALPILSPLFLREGFAGELESWQFRSMKFTKIFLFKSKYYQLFLTTWDSKPPIKLNWKCKVCLNVIFLWFLWFFYKLKIIL